jgi:hypothetical protein
MNKRLYKTTKPKTKCSPLQAFPKRLKRPHRGLKTTKTRKHTAETTLKSSCTTATKQLQTFTITSLSKKAEKTSQRLITTKNQK